MSLLLICGYTLLPLGGYGAGLDLCDISVIFLSVVGKVCFHGEVIGGFGTSDFS